jgi:HEPN superfamily AbiU2-like protein
MRWGAYRQLYMSDPRGRGLLSWGAGALFAIIDQALLDSIVLTIVRLLDRAESRHQMNATFGRLSKIVRSEKLKRKVEVALLPARSFADAFRVRRNKQLAHADLRVAQGRYPKAWPNRSVSDLEAAIGALGETLNTIAQSYGLTTIDYAGFRDMASGADRLRSLLRRMRQQG